MKYADKKEEIKALVSDGNNILEIQEENIITFWCVQSFEPSSGSSTASIDYNSFVKGVDITEFLHNSALAGNPTIFKNQFQAHCDKEPKISMKFSNKFLWRQYTNQLR